jgi:hypothetical protein
VRDLPYALTPHGVAARTPLFGLFQVLLSRLDHVNRHLKRDFMIGVELLAIGSAAVGDHEWSWVASE